MESAIITDCQRILAEHLPPDGPDARTTISRLLEILDGPRVLRAASTQSMQGTPSLKVVDGLRSRDGERSYSMTVDRAGEQVELAMMFAPDGETFDPGEVVSFAREETPDNEEPLLPGDILSMRFEMIS